jgi:nickel/cobalt transporter (NicO) family protein
MSMDLLGAAGLGDRLVAAVDSAHFAPVALVIAFLAGATHAVGPGHGKSLAAAYLVGSGGRYRDAAWLGGSVAAMHTVSVLVLALLWTFADLSGLIGLDQLTSGLQVVAGLLVVGLGAWLVRRRLGSAGHGHHHHHGHSHDHDHGHSHDISRPGLLLLGASGGLTPSPAAFLVLVTGLFSGRSGLALLLVVVFGLGLATTLFLVGLLAITGRTVVFRMARGHHLLDRARRVAPVLAAGSIVALGTVITVLGISGMVATA